MKKICLSVVGIVLSLFGSFAQSSTDSSHYKMRKLTFEEANLVTSYYHQDGNHSAVTGGIGTEKLADYSASFDIKFYRYDHLNRKHVFDFEAGADHYTSASSDKVNPRTVSSASAADTRIYPSATWSMENEKKGSTIGGGLAFSKEYDYFSIGPSLSLSKKTKNRNGEFSAKLQAYIDHLKYIIPAELRPGGAPSEDPHEADYPSRSRNSFSTSLSYSQVVNQRLQLMLLLDLVYQQGYLGLPFHRVYFNDNSLQIENLPDSRFKIPIGIRGSYFIGDNIILRAFYRYYRDDWGLQAHTADLETVVKITPFLSVTPFYRYYQQTAIKYFAPYKEHTTADQFYTSNYDLSEFNAHFFGAGFRIIPPGGLFGSEHLNMLELRYGHYMKNIGMNSDIISLNLKFK